MKNDRVLLKKLRHVFRFLDGLPARLVVSRAKVESEDWKVCFSTPERP